MPKQRKNTERTTNLQTGIEAGKNQTYLYKHLDLDAWLADLRDDRTQLGKIYRIAQNITTARDAKLEQLKELIAAKVQHPTENSEGKENRKILVFTAFADTANYLYNNLHTNGQRRHLILKVRCRYRWREQEANLVRNDFDEILTNFSPISKEPISKETEESETEGKDELPEIDLLIATDCISEGQNLQDCDYLINYDIHWNPCPYYPTFRTD